MLRVQSQFQGILTVPGCLINIANGGLAGQRGNGFVVRHDGTRNPINHLLHRSQAHGDMQDVMAKVLNEASRAAVHAGELPHESGQTRAITGLMSAGYLGFESPSTTATSALMQDERLDIYLDRWQFDDLVGVVGFKRYELAMAAGTGAGLDEMDLGGAEQLGALASVAFLPATFARGLASGALGFVEGRIR